MEDILILAGSDQELIDRYLDKEKNAPDYAQLKELEEKHGRGYGLTDTVYAQLKRRLFQSALKILSRVYARNSGIYANKGSGRRNVAMKRNLYAKHLCRIL